MKTLALLALALPLAAQNTVAWKATTGAVSLTGSGTTATVQKPSTAPQGLQIFLEKIHVYCSVACSFTQTANGTAATATAGTVVPVLPANPSAALPISFYTASNVGAGTDQGGIVYVPAGGTAVICLAVSCGNSTNVYLGSKDSGVGTNYSVIISSITGTANITFFGTVKQ